MHRQPRSWFFIFLLAIFCFAASWGSRQFGFSQQAYNLIPEGLRDAAFYTWIGFFSLGSVLGGVAADRLPSKGPFLSTITMAGMGTLLVAVGEPQSVLRNLIGLALLSAGQGASFPLAVRLVAGSQPDTRWSRAILLLTWGQSTSAAAAAPLSLLVVQWGWKPIFLTISVVTILLGVMVYLALFGRVSETEPAAEVPPILIGLRNLITIPSLLTCFACAVLMAAIQSAWQLELRFVAQKLEERLIVSKVTAGMLFAFPNLAAGFAIVGGAIVGDLLMRRSSRAHISWLVPGLAVTSLCVFGLKSVPESFTLVGLVGLSFGLFYGLFRSNAVAAILDVAPKHSRGFVIGLLTSATTVANMVIEAGHFSLVSPSLVVAGCLASLLMLWCVWKWFPADQRLSARAWGDTSIDRAEIPTDAEAR